MNKLVARLCEGKHPVEVALLSESPVEDFQKRILDGYVHIKFTNTAGGTVLGVDLNEEVCDLSKANFEKHSGIVHIVGSLILNYTNVLCNADIDLATLTGEGCLEVVTLIEG